MEDWKFNELMAEIELSRAKKKLMNKEQLMEKKRQEELDWAEAKKRLRNSMNECFFRKLRAENEAIKASLARAEQLRINAIIAEIIPRKEIDLEEKEDPSFARWEEKVNNIIDRIEEKAKLKAAGEGATKILIEQDSAVGGGSTALISKL